MGKFKIRYVAVPLMLAAVAGGVFGYLKIKESKALVKVAPVSGAADMMYFDASEGNSFYGSLTKGSFSSVKLDPELTVVSVNVKKDDTVKKGDLLITYDTHSLEDCVEDSQLQVNTLTREIEHIDKELSVLKVLLPSESDPNANRVPDEEEPEPEPETFDVPEEFGGDMFFEDDTPDMPDEMPQEEPYAEPELPNTDTDIDEYSDITLKDHFKYSRQEIKDMISQRDSDKASKSLMKKQAELDVKRYKRLAEKGGETALIDGRVTFVAKDINHLSESGAYITISNEGGLSVTSSVGEFSLDKIREGMSVTIENYETGMSGTGTVTYVSDQPSDENSSGGKMSEGLESMYSFTVAADDDMEISEDTEVRISLMSEESMSDILLPAPILRSEGGRYYVMIAGDDGRLVKRYVKVGAMQWEMVEIVSGLSGDDLIAFPYGNAVEGAQTVEAESFEDMYYNFGLLM